MPIPPLRLRLEGDALVANWRAMAALSGSARCGAAVKADAYGLGAHEVVDRLARAGCRDFFVATWDEVEALGPVPSGCALSVLHGARVEDMPRAVASTVRPVLSTEAQVARWKPTGRSCDVMVDTGINRLGVSMTAVEGGLLDGLSIETLMSHLASADEDSALNETQRARFASLYGRTSAHRMSLSNSAGIGLGAGYRFDLTRPGLALYGGVPRPEMGALVRQVAFPEAQVLQRRRIEAGEGVGYNATFIATRPTEIATLNIGYADGYARAFSGIGTAGGGRFPVLGRVSMDMIALDVSSAPEIGEGDWVGIDYRLWDASALSGITQYELLTRLGGRFDKLWA